MAIWAYTWAAVRMKVKWEDFDFLLFVICGVIDICIIGAIADGIKGAFRP